MSYAAVTGGPEDGFLSRQRGELEDLWLERAGHLKVAELALAGRSLVAHEGALQQEIALEHLREQRRLRDQVEDIWDAVERIETGTYGICQMCRRRITSERLEALPAARFCLACASSDRIRAKWRAG